MIIFVIHLLLRGHTKVLANNSPAGHHSELELWKQKRRGSKVFRVLIPKIRLSHCPYLRISNTKPAHAVMIYTHHGTNFPRQPTHGHTETPHTHCRNIHTQRLCSHKKGNTPYYIYKGNDSRRVK
jgi:hypothetical protein